MSDPSGSEERTRFVEDLLSYLTFEEKLGQLDLFHDATDPALEQHIADGRVGGLIGVGVPARLQALAIERSRSGIPLLLTGRPAERSTLSPWALAASWDEDLARTSGKAAAYAERARGNNCMFRPIVSLGHSDAPVAATIAACDPLLGARLAAAFASGAQQDSLAPDNCATILAVPTWQGDTSAESLAWAVALANAGRVEAIDCIAFGSMTAQRLGFTGLLAVECRRLHDLVAYHYTTSRARSPREAADLALADGLVNEAEIEMAVRGVLAAKHAMGLFRTSERGVASALPETTATDDQQALRRTMVLLRNEAGVLPFSPVSDRVLVVGPSDGAMPACASALGRAGIGHSCAPGLAQRRTDESWSLAAPGDSFALSLTIDAARRADFVMVVLDDRHFISHAPGNWRQPGPPTVAMLTGLAQSGTRIIAIIATAEPVDLAVTDQYFTAVLQSWGLSPGYEEALSDILSGQCSPQGRMSIGAGRYLSGHGMGYGETAFSGFTISTQNDHVLAQVTVRNAGAFAMRETVQVYARSASGELRLIAFEHVYLAPGDAKPVNLALGIDALGVPGTGRTLELTPGPYEILVGKSRDRWISRNVEISPALARIIANRGGARLRVAAG